MGLILLFRSVRTSYRTLDARPPVPSRPQEKSRSPLQPYKSSQDHCCQPIKIEKWEKGKKEKKRKRGKEKKRKREKGKKGKREKEKKKKRKKEKKRKGKKGKGEKGK